MPFVPLGSRKRLDVILDADKERILNDMRDRDAAKVNAHFGVTPSSTGYRFGKHPSTMGSVRGPDVPFKDATSTWRPPSADPDGPAANRTMQMADHGAHWEASHSMRRMRSSPFLQSPGSTLADAREASRPLNVELKRWEKLATSTMGKEMQGSTMKDRESERGRSEPAKPREVVRTPGLVNFPKYMLFNNCHLKQMDQHRFSEKETEARAQAEQSIRLGLTPASRSMSLPFQDAPDSSVPWQHASWGAPMLGDPVNRTFCWSGSSLPAGRGQRTSNPFRQG